MPYQLAIAPPKAGAAPSANIKRADDIPTAGATFLCNKLRAKQARNCSQYSDIETPQTNPINHSGQLYVVIEASISICMA